MTAANLALQVPPMTQIRYLDSRYRSDALRVVLQSDGPGVVEAPELDSPCIAIHVGRPVRLDCRHGVQNHSGLAIHGDIDIIPQGMTSRWEMKEADTALILRLGRRLLGQAAEESGFNNRVEIRSRFRVRDSHIEHIGWALMAEAHRGYPSGRLYLDSMATTLAVELLRGHSSVSGNHAMAKGGMPRHKLRQAQSYIEENLHRDLSLQTIAEAIGMSASHLKNTFSKTTGTPVHQYVIRRRVERAALLLREGRLPISQVAVAVGFAHQSHLALHMRRLLGLSPRHVVQASGF